MHRYLRRRNRDRPRAFSRDAENVLVVGVSDLCWYYIQMVENLASDLYSIVALVDDSRSLQNRFVHGYPIAGQIKDLDAILEEYDNHGVPIHRLMIAAKSGTLEADSLAQVRRAASGRGIIVDELEQRLGFSRNREPEISEPKVAFPDQAPGSPRFWKSKRAFDILVSGVLLLVTLPITALVSLAVLIDLGAPLLFWQVRVGRGGRKVTIYKFRTLQAKYRIDDQPLSWTDRVSWLGAVLRRTHLDELPQLLGILAGDMSLIGPRPLLPVDLSENVGVRSVVRPGITGWAQVNGGTLLTREEKKALDDWYVRHASWRLELRILCRTVLELFRAGKRNEAAIAEALREEAADTDQRPARPSDRQGRASAVHEFAAAPATAEEDGAS